MQTIPYFLTNTDWYYFDEDEFRYVLTEKATDNARKSYDEFYKIEESIVHSFTD